VLDGIDDRLDVRNCCRVGAGGPLNASRFSHHTRRPATANAMTVSTSPMIMRAIISSAR